MSEYGPLIAGLDPGAAGGIGLLAVDGGFQAAYPLPQSERDIYELVLEYAPHITRAYLEFVHAFPGQGVVSTFTFGRNYGFLRGLLVALKIPYEDIRPEKWTKTLGFKRTQRGGPTKKLHRAWAQQWFPRLKISPATADAILIAEYGRRQEQPPPLIAAMNGADAPFKELVK